MPEKNFSPAYTFYLSVALLICNLEKRLPMDKNSTPELEITGSLVEQALKRDKYPKPSATSLAFLKNFARNFKVHQSVEGDIRELVLN